MSILLYKPSLYYKAKRGVPKIKKSAVNARQVSVSSREMVFVY